MAPVAAKRKQKLPTKKAGVAASSNIMLKKVTLMFPALHKLKMNTLSNKMEYSTAVKLEKDHPQIDKLWTSITELVESVFGPEAIDHPDFNIFLKEADEDDQETFGHDCSHFFNCKASEDQPPLLVGPDKKELTEFSSLSNNAVANIMLNLYCYSNAGNVGVTAYIKAVQVLKPGTRMLTPNVFDDESDEYASEWGTAIEPEDLTDDEASDPAFVDADDNI